MTGSVDIPRDEIIDGQLVVKRWSLEHGKRSMGLRNAIYILLSHVHVASRRLEGYCRNPAAEMTTD